MLDCVTPSVELTEMMCLLTISKRCRVLTREASHVHLSMLPLLPIGGDQKRPVEHIEGEGRKKPTLVHGLLHKVDWIRLMKHINGPDPNHSDIRKPETHAVHFVASVPNSQGTQHKITLELRKDLLYPYLQLVLRNGEGELCVETDVIPPDSLNVENLFNFMEFDEDKDENSKCLVEPTKGRGDAVLTVFGVIADSMGLGGMSVEDGAMFTHNSPFVKAGNMTKTLALLRGFGYYEARGFISIHLINGVDKYELPKAKRMDLTWTHALTTTPIKDLYTTILNFHSVVAQEPIPEFTQRLYSPQNCKECAERAKDVIDEMNLIFRRCFGDNSYQELSMRELANKINIQFETGDEAPDPCYNTLFYKFMHQVWQLRIPREYGDFYAYPGQDLTKAFWKSGDESSFMACVKNPVAGEKPILEWRLLRTDITVTFTSFEGIRFSE